MAHAVRVTERQAMKAQVTQDLDSLWHDVRKGLEDLDDLSPVVCALYHDPLPTQQEQLWAENEAKRRAAAANRDWSEPEDDELG